MKEKIKEVHDYFKKRIVDGDYEISDVKRNYIVILIDGYEFSLWTANEDNGLALYFDSFMNFVFDKDEKLSIYKMLKPIIVKNKRDVLMVAKKAELKKLEEEIAATDDE